MLDKIEEALLDKAYRLQRKREEQILESGQTITIDGRPEKALIENTTFYTHEKTTIAPGSIIRHPDFIACFLVLTTELQAGRLKSETLELTTAFTLMQKYSKGLNQFQQPVYGIKSTSWRNIPCTGIHGNQVRIPKLYTPDNGELLLIGDQTYEVLSTRSEGPVCVATVREW